MKFLAISDTHFGRTTGDEVLFRSNVQTLVNRVQEENPDELVLVGDIIDSLYSENLEENVHRDLLFQLIDSCDDVVYVPGNHDLLYRGQSNLGRARIVYPFYIKDRIMFIHGHQFEIFHVFPFRYSDLNRVLRFVDRFWEFCPRVFEEVERTYAGRGISEVERIKQELVSMRARTFVRVISRIFMRMVMRGELAEMSSSTFTLLSMVMPKVLKGEPFYSQNPGVLDSKMKEYGRNWTSEEFSTICYGHTHRSLLMRNTYFSFANCGSVSEAIASYVVLDSEGRMRVEKL